MNKYYSLTDQQIEFVIQQLPLKTLQSKTNSWLAICPFHNDTNPSLRISKKSGLYHCFSCGSSGNLFSLTKVLLKTSLYKLLGIEADILSNYWLQNINKKYIREKAKIDVEMIISDGKLYSITASSDIRILQYLKYRKISFDFVKQYNIQYTFFCKINETIFKDRLIIPIIVNNKIVSYEGRTFTKANPKVLYPRNSNVSSLFNIDNLKYNEPLFLVEGIMDLAPLFNLGYRNITCTFGSNIKQEQLQQLKQFSEIIVIPDNDIAGSKFLDQIDESLTKEFYIVKLSDKYKDCGDTSLSSEELQYLIDKKIKYGKFLLEKSNLFNETLVDW